MSFVARGEKVPQHTIDFSGREVAVETVEDVQKIVANIGEPILAYQPKQGNADIPRFGPPGELYPVDLSYAEWLERNNVTLVKEGPGTPARSAPSPWRKVNNLEVMKLGSGVLLRVEDSIQFVDNVRVVDVERSPWSSAGGGVRLLNLTVVGSPRGVVIVAGDALTYAAGKTALHFQS